MSLLRAFAPLLVWLGIVLAGYGGLYFHHSSPDGDLISQIVVTTVIAVSFYAALVMLANRREWPVLACGLWLFLFAVVVTFTGRFVGWHDGNPSPAVDENFTDLGRSAFLMACVLIAVGVTGYLRKGRTFVETAWAPADERGARPVDAATSIDGVHPIPEAD